MSKLYVFGIGGTGSRVLKSLTMLLASGVECGVDTIVPIVIDRDEANRDYTRTNLLIGNYIAVNEKAETKEKKRFFKTKIKLLNNELCLRLNEKTQKFNDFIGKNSMSNENQALIEMLFSEKTLNMDMVVGFKGNPNIGSIVLNQFDDSDIFKAFATDFKAGDKIFIISSIFGGTGASGFPLLRKVLQTPNVKDSKGNMLPNWGHVNKAKIGAISVLPYFLVQPATDADVDSDTFIDKTKAALTYYKQENGKLDTLYYIADKRTSTYEHNEGGDAQKNNAHFVELAAALSILDFVNPQKEADNIHRDTDGGIESTTYKEFAIKEDSNEINFASLEDETKKLIVEPLSRFMLFCKYMGYYRITEHVENNEKKVECKKTYDNVFDKEMKHQPYAKKRLGKDFRTMDVIQKLAGVQEQFCIWLYEMEKQTRKFSPFNLSTSSAFEFIYGDINVVSKKGRYREWAKIDNELNRVASEVPKSLNNEPYFLEIFYRATSKFIKLTQ